MKTIKSIFKFQLVLLVFVGTTTLSIAKEKQATMEKEFDIDAKTELVFNCHRSDLVIKTWDNKRIKLTGKITVRGNDENDIKTLVDAFKNPEIDKTFNQLKINTRFYKSFTQTPFGSKLRLKNKDRVSVKDFTSSYILYVPKEQSLNLKSKYNKIKSDNLTGKVTMEIYNGELEGGNFGTNYSLKLTYSKAELKNGTDGKITLYDSDVVMGSIGNADITSKYSEISIGKAGDIMLESYDDNIAIEEVQNLKSEAKYSEFEINKPIRRAEFEIYDCMIEANNIKIIELDAKYSSLDIGVIGMVNAGELYDNEIQFEGVVEFHCNESKYDNIKLGSISEKLEMGSVHDSDIKAGRISEKFKSFRGEFKYSSVDLPLPELFDFKIHFDTKYGSVDFPEAAIKEGFKSSKKHDHWEFEGATSENPECEIEFTSYDSDFDFN